jgi:SAM-dependent methyltransferase
MTPEEAYEQVSQRFPFQLYMSGVDESYLNIAATVQKYLSSGDRILDFGSGPCNKTAVLQMLGFQCTAYDDLLDDWHKQADNKEKILQFAKDSGIEFKLAVDRFLPFEKGSFDMVMAHNVLDHLHHSPRDLMNDLVELIKPDGYLFVTLPNAANIKKRIFLLLGKTNMPSFDSYYWYPGGWRGHVREYVKDDLRKLTTYLHLDIVELRGCHHMLKKVPPTVRPFYVFLSSIFTGWRDSWMLVARRPANWSPNKNLPKDEFAMIMRKVAPYTY